MPVHWEFSESIIVVTVVGYGGEEPAKAIQEAMADGRFKAGMSLLFDMREATDNPSSEELRARAAFVSSLGRRGISSRCAIVIGDKPYQFGLARMAATYGEFQGMELEIFRGMGEALQWLERSGMSEPTTK